MKKIKAIIYARIPLYTGHMYDIKTQLKICAAYCEETKLQVVGRVMESRDGLDRESLVIDFLKSLAGKEFDVVVCTEYTRLFRDPIQYKKLHMALKEKGVDVHLCADDFNNSLMAKIYDGIPSKTKS